jgi:hypothetical protein
MASLGQLSGLALTLTDPASLAMIAWAADVVFAAPGVEILRSRCKGEVGPDVVAALSMVFSETLVALAAEPMPVRGRKS